MEETIEDIAGKVDWHQVVKALECFEKEFGLQSAARGALTSVFNEMGQMVRLALYMLLAAALR